MIKISLTDHRLIEAHALRIKIEKLSQWMQLYRDNKLNGESNRHAINVLTLLHEAQIQQKLFNNQQKQFIK